MQNAEFVASIKETTHDTLRPLVEVLIAGGFPYVRFETLGFSSVGANGSEVFFDRGIEAQIETQGFAAGVSVAGLVPYANLEFIRLYPVAGMHAIGRLVRLHSKHAVPYIAEFTEDIYSRITKVKGGIIIINPGIRVQFDPRIVKPETNPFSDNGPLPIFASTVKSARTLEPILPEDLIVVPVDFPLVHIPGKTRKNSFDRQVVEQCFLNAIRTASSEIMRKYLGMLGINGPVNEDILRASRIYSSLSSV